MTASSSHRRLLGLLLALASLLLSAPSPAHADTASKILAACGSGRIPSGYSQQDYKGALKKMSPFLSEYTDCEELIHRAQLAAVGGRRGGSGGGPSNAANGSAGAAVAPPTPVEQRALEHAHRTGAVPVQVGDQVIHPGVVHANIASAASTLPTPLLVVLAFLLACALLMSGWVLQRHVRAGRAN